MQTRRASGARPLRWVAVILIWLLLASCAGDSTTTTTAGLGSGETTTSQTAASETTQPTAESSPDIPDTVPEDLREIYLNALEENPVTMYTNLIVQDVELVREQVAAVFPGIEIRFIRTGAAPTIARVEQEIANDNILGDVVMVSDQLWMEDLYQRDLLLEFESPDFAAWPAEFKRDNYYFANSMYLIAISYNTNELTGDQVPVTWTDIPTYGSRGGAFDPRIGGGGYTLVHFIHELIGPQWWADLAAAGTQFHNTGGAFLPLLNSGELVAAAFTHQAASCDKAEGLPLEVVYPEEGVPSVESYVAVMKGTHSPNAATLLARFIMTEQGQIIVNHGQCTFSPRPGVPQAEVLPDLDSLNVVPITPDQIAAHREEYQAAAADAAGVPLEAAP